MVRYTGTFGNDFYQYTGTERLFAFGYAGNDTLVGSSNNDSLSGGSGDDSLIGGLGNDTLIGGAGNDTLDGGTGNDSMAGGDGNDIYFVDSTRDRIRENANQGNDTVFSSVSYTLGNNLENLVLTGNATRGTGNSLDNYIFGNNLNNSLDGAAGNDTIYGGAGNDTIYGGIGTDFLYGEDGNDFIVGGTSTTLDTSSNYLDGGAGNDTIQGGNADDFLLGGDGNDLLYGYGGNDTLDGGSGIDTLVGGTGNDAYYIDNPADTIIEYANEGIDTVVSSFSYTLGNNLENLYITGNAAEGYGNSLNNTIFGNNFNNFLSGRDGDDTLSGEGGNDTLLGGSGNDLLVGGDGNDRLDGYSTSGIEFDTLSGGAGADTFVLGGFWGVSYLDSGYATITDWDGSSDIIEISSVGTYTYEFGDFNSGTAALDTAIYYNSRTGRDLIAVVQDSTNVSVQNFKFV